MTDLSAHLDVIRKALERHRLRMEEVAALGWYMDSTPTDNEIARIDAAIAALDTLPAPGDAQPVALDAPELREALAENAHEAWSGWMKYMFGKGHFEPRLSTGGNLTATEQVYIMPSWAVERWVRQMNTPYADLPEAEKQSDREEADKMLAIVKRTTPNATPGAAQQPDTQEDNNVS